SSRHRDMTSSRRMRHGSICCATTALRSLRKLENSLPPVRARTGAATAAAALAPAGSGRSPNTSNPPTPRAPSLEPMKNEGTHRRSRGLLPGESLQVGETAKGTFELDAAHAARAQ